MPGLSVAPSGRLRLTGTRQVAVGQLREGRLEYLLPDPGNPGGTFHAASHLADAAYGQGRARQGALDLAALRGFVDGELRSTCAALLHGIKGRYTLKRLMGLWSSVGGGP